MLDVILLAHGSPDPRAQRAARAFARAVERRHARAHVHCAFLDHGESLADVARGLADEGIGRAIVVPAFLAQAHHLRVDVPRVVASAQSSSGVELVVTEAIGTDAALIEELDRVLPSGPVTLAIAGTRDPESQRQLNEVAHRWSQTRRAPIVVAHASLGEPSIPDAIAALEQETSEPAAVASFVLFPGILPDRIADAAGHRVITEPLYLSEATVDVVVERIRSAA